jgi:hypothetical protein
MFKAIAKGYELVNNICVMLSNKFNPIKCTDDELESVAFLVGTDRLKGSSSGLLVTATNNTDDSVILPKGTYTYEFDADTKFIATIPEAVTILHNNFTQFTMLSETIGKYPVTAQNEIKLTAVDDDTEVTIPEELVFSNADNQTLLGYDDETDLEFRKRIIEDTNRQDVISEIKTAVKNLPFVFDCDIKFNDSTQDILYDDYTIPPFYMLLLVSGDMRSEIAQTVASKGIYPTVNKAGESVAIQYVNDVFADGHYDIYVTPYKKENFSVQVMIQVDSDFISFALAESKIRIGLLSAVNVNRHVDVLTENDIYTYVSNLNLEGVKVLGVNINNPQDLNNKNYITFLKTRVPFLTDVNVTNVGV